MSDPPKEDQTSARATDMLFAVGDCVLAWSLVEAKLSDIFQLCLDIKRKLADDLLGTPRAFDVRSSLVHIAVKSKIKDATLLSDWCLLYNHIRLVGGRRNEVAHALMVGADELEPYFALSSRKPTLSIAEVERRAGESRKLYHCLLWFKRKLAETPSAQHPRPSRPEPHLLLELRAEDLRRRAEQRAQQQPSPPKSAKTKKPAK